MASNLIDCLNKPSGTLEAITIAMITHKDEAPIAYSGFQHHCHPSAENQ